MTADAQTMIAAANGGAPSVLVAYGPLAVQRLKESKLRGKFMVLEGLAS